MQCPRCQCPDYYLLRGRSVVRCKECRHDYSERSCTEMKFSKLSPETQDKLRALLGTGMSILVASKAAGVQYKTAHAFALKIGGPAESTELFEPGDLVLRGGSEDNLIGGVVTWVYPNGRMVRVRTDDGRSRIWLTKNTTNLMRELP